MIKLLGVTPIDNYILELDYGNNNKRHFDVKPLLSKGKFQELKDLTLFNQVRLSFDTVCWANGMDICPDYLYSDSKPIS